MRGAELLLLLPLVASVLARERSAYLLERAAAWLEQHTRPIKMTVSIVFGSYFLWKGITGSGRASQNTPSKPRTSR